MHRKKLPIGIQTFRHIREDGCYYVVELAPEGRAQQLIKDRGYADRHRASGEPIQLIDVEFSRKQRTVVGFEVEHLA
jgi:hypothetical protein